MHFDLNSLNLNGTKISCSEVTTSWKGLLDSRDHEMITNECKISFRPCFLSLSWKLQNNWTINLRSKVSKLWNWVWILTNWVWIFNSFISRRYLLPLETNQRWMLHQHVSRKTGSATFDKLGHKLSNPQKSYVRFSAEISPQMTLLNLYMSLYAALALVLTMF